MTYCSGNTYWYLRDKHIGRAIRITAIKRWHIVRTIRLAAYGTKISVEQYVLLRLSDDILFGQYVLLPTGQTYRSGYTYCCAYAMTYCSGNTYCCLRDKYIGRAIRITALTRWHIVRVIRIDTYGTNTSVELYVLLRLSDDISFGQYVLLPTGQINRSSNTYCCA